MDEPENLNPDLAHNPGNHIGNDESPFANVRKNNPFKTVHLKRRDNAESESNSKDPSDMKNVQSFLSFQEFEVLINISRSQKILLVPLPN